MSKYLVLIFLALIALLIIPASATTTATPAYGSEIHPGDDLVVNSYISGGDSATDIRYKSFKGTVLVPSNFTYFGGELTPHTTPIVIPYNIPADALFLTFDIKWHGSWFSAQEASGLWWYYNSTIVPKANVTFSISETGNFTNKLSGVAITLSNGQTNTTGTNGEAFIRVSPNGSAYTYTAIKSGYETITDEPLGGYGETGGIAYVEMTPGYTAGDKLVNLLATDATTGSFIDGFTGNVYDPSINKWTNATYPGGVGEIYTNRSVTLTGYLSATGYTSTSSTWTAKNDDFDDFWVVPMYKTTDVPPADPTISNLRVSILYSDTNTPASNVNVLNTGDGTYRLTPGSGVVIFNVTNNTDVTLVASKSGYHDTTKIFTINAAIITGSMSITEDTVAPTPTLAPGETVPVTPTLTGSDLEEHNRTQASEAMQVLYDNATGLIGLCVLVIIMRLINMI